ncbi:hypothetical protein ACJJTC_004913 [Scirpophaga incertulas]
MLRVLSKTPKTAHVNSLTNDSAKDCLPLRGRPPKHKQVEKVSRTEAVSEDESECSGGSKRWRGDADDAESCRRSERSAHSETGHRSERSAHSETERRSEHSAHSEVERRGPAAAAPLEPRAHLARCIAQLALPPDPASWDERDVSALVSLVGGGEAGAAARAARVRGPDLLAASRDELVGCLRLRLGPAVKVYAAIRVLREACS